MSKQKTSATISRMEAADRLAALAAELRSGALKVDNAGTLTVADEVEMKTKIDDDELEIKIEWEKAE